MTIGRTTLSHHVAQEIIGEIKLRGPRAGDEIPAEGELAERHGVNRLAVREAIRTLVARGVLVSGQGKRARVAVPAPAVLEQIIDFRLSQNSMDLVDPLDSRRASYRGRERRGAGQEATVEAHRRIADAIAAGEGDRAAEAMTAHLAETGHDLGL
ncbi:GntR family transcriptional regulator [Streptomyces sp. NBC_00876]|uniref:FadR/GntR family transcriptional regulator n=1 Tax=Streptomyces sp. NBC_00876 TaxID=2975853 RepID=UPI0038706DDD|nr:GntR family transcriptional regulator [Streptomyces sp. NBC_00876]